MTTVQVWNGHGAGEGNARVHLRWGMLWERSVWTDVMLTGSTVGCVWVVGSVVGWFVWVFFLDDEEAPGNCRIDPVG